MRHKQGGKNLLIEKLKAASILNVIFKSSVLFLCTGNNMLIKFKRTSVYLGFLMEMVLS